MDVLAPNAVLVGGPEPIGGRHVRAEQGALEVRAGAGDGSGLHVWSRTGRMEPRGGGGWVRVYVYTGPADQPIAL